MAEFDSVAHADLWTVILYKGDGFTFAEVVRFRDPVEAERYAEHLPNGSIYRLMPPTHHKGEARVIPNGWTIV